ncbi:MerR family transcriptional regulator [Tsukamurella sp. PLM1]|uniref:MerR family transcriptional regulator n=1 Tax=Tsukamurella sp. PLM1 TaxID=2929795 RepID=UPI003530025D
MSWFMSVSLMPPWIVPLPILESVAILCQDRIMKLSELSTETGVSTASLKYYLRESLLAPGDPVTRTQSEYGPAHVERVRLIRAWSRRAVCPWRRSSRSSTRSTARRCRAWTCSAWPSTASRPTTP